MTGQGWVEYGLAGAMAVTAAYCAARLVLPRLRRAAAGHVESDAVHVAMAVAMAAMLLGVAEPIWGGPIVLLFAVPAVWFAFRSVRQFTSSAPVGRECADSSMGHVQLSIASFAMVYMSGVVPGLGSVSTAAGTRILDHSETHLHGSSAPGSATITAGVASVDFALVGGVLFGLLAAFAVVSLARLSASADRRAMQQPQSSWTSRLTLCCQLAMGARWRTCWP